MSGPFEGNLKALESRNPPLAGRVRGAPEPAGCELVEGKLPGAVSIRAPGPDGTPILLHSAYNPAQEAERLIDSTESVKFNTFIVFGFGLGYHVQRLLAVTSKESFIYVVEASLSLLRKALELRDLADVLGSPRVFFVVEEPMSGFFTELFTEKLRVCAGGLKFCIHAPLVRLAPDFYANVRKEAGEYMIANQTSMVTAFFHARHTCRNQILNIPLYALRPGIADVGDRLKGYPAVIVSAGPSLAKTIDLLAEYRDRAVIFATDVLLKMLLARGIRPHFTTVLDFQEHTGRFFEGVEGLEETHLVASPKAYHGTVTLYKGPVCFTSDDAVRKLLGEDFPDRGRCSTGMNVAHFAFSAAEFLGCDPIIFIGQDLGYPDDITHMPGSALYGMWQPERNRFYTFEMKELEEIRRRKNVLLRVEDIHGNMMYTDRSMLSYLKIFEGSIARSPAKCIDATGGGARIAGTELLDFGECARRYMTRPAPRIEFDRPQEDIGSLELAGGILRKRIEECRIMDGLYREAKGLFRKIEKDFHDREKIRHYTAKVGALRDKVAAYEDLYAVLTYFMPADILERVKRDWDISSSEPTGHDRLRAQLDRDKEYCKALLAGLKDMEEILRTALAECKDLAGRLAR